MCFDCDFDKLKTKELSINLFLQNSLKTKKTDLIKTVVSNGREGLYEVSYTDSINKEKYSIVLLLEDIGYIKAYRRAPECAKYVKKILKANSTLTEDQKKRIVNYFRHIGNLGL